MSCTKCKQCSVKKSAKKLLKWPKYRYYSDRLLEILKNFEKENIFFFRKRVYSKITSNVSNRIVFKYTLTIWHRISAYGKKGFGVSPLKGFVLLATPSRGEDGVIIFLAAVDISVRIKHLFTSSETVEELGKGRHDCW